MPYYTYNCTNCEAKFEKNVYMANRDEVYCSTCGTKATRGIDRPGMVWSPTRNGGYST